MSVEEKKLAAKRAVEYISSNTIIGLGTGSTASHAIRFIGEKYNSGSLSNIKAVASSVRSEELAKELGIPLVDLNEITSIDITIDGADEFDPYLNLIKGGGGALVREKILAALSTRFVVIVDSQKQVPQLGAFPLPVEVLKFSAAPITKKLESLHLQPKLRLDKNGQPFISDNDNYIVDLHLKKIKNPVALDSLLKSIPGIIDNGLFIGMADTVVVGKGTDVLVYE